MQRPLRFHWNLPIEGTREKESERANSGGIDLAALRKFIELADGTAIESLLTPFGFHMPDPLVLLGAAAAWSKRVTFMLAYRSGLMSPTLFTQQVNTLSHFLQGRLTLNMIAGFSPEEQKYYGDHLEHDDRYARAEEFLDICRLLWKSADPVDYAGSHYTIERAQLKTSYAGTNGNALEPRIYVSGNSSVAARLAKHKDACWLRYADTPEKVAAATCELRQAGVSVGLRMSVIARETRDEALAVAYRVVANPDLEWREFIRQTVQRSDSVAVRSTYALGERAESWLSPTLWVGAVPYRGGPAMALVGTYDEVARSILEYRRHGVSELILSGWPTLDEMLSFDREVIPRVRRLEMRSGG